MSFFRTSILASFGFDTINIQHTLYLSQPIEILLAKKDPFLHKRNMSKTSEEYKIIQANKRWLKRQYPPKRKPQHYSLMGKSWPFLEDYKRQGIPLSDKPQE